MALGMSVLRYRSLGNFNALRAVSFATKTGDASGRGPFPGRQDSAFDRPVPRAFPSRQNSVDTLKKRDFMKLAKEFGSYGQFQNYCREHKIELTKEERSKIMAAVWNV